MTIKELYEKYKIMPNLEEHQLRVAGIGKVLVESWVGGEVDGEMIIMECLLHDMGNIVKFNLSDEGAGKFGIENIEYWRRVQEEFIDRYGNDAVEASIAILEEVGREDVADMLREEYAYAHETDKDKYSWEAKMLAYCDLRVMPHGVVSLEERIEDLINRYGDKWKEWEFAAKLESEIQARTKVDVRQIEENQVKKYFPELLEMEI